MKYILWDFDGTLAYREGKWAGALLEVVRREHPKRQISASELRPHLLSGFPWHTPERVRPPEQPADVWWAQLEPVFASAFVKGAGFPQDEARRLARLVREVYVDPKYWRVFDDTVECLERLRTEGWKHVILSNHVPELPGIVSRLGLSPYVSAVYNSARLGVEKPNPEIFRRALADLAPYQEVWMVGDNPLADVACAEAVGIPAILVRGTSPGVSRQAAALSEVPALLRHG